MKSLNIGSRSLTQHCCFVKPQQVRQQIGFKAPLKFNQNIRKNLSLKAGGEEQLASSYATALFLMADKQKQVKQVQNDVDNIKNLITSDERLQKFLYSPVVEIKQKQDVIDKIAGKAQLSKPFKNFLYLLMEKNRLPQLIPIADAFEAQYNQKTDTQIASVRSAVPLGQEQQFQIAKKLQQVTGSKNIKLKPSVDKELLGGFVIEYGSTFIDLSIKGQLERISGELASLSA